MPFMIGAGPSWVRACQLGRRGGSAGRAGPHREREGERGCLGASREEGSRRGEALPAGKRVQNQRCAAHGINSGGGVCVGGGGGAAQVLYLVFLRFVFRDLHSAIYKEKVWIMNLFSPPHPTRSIPFPPCFLACLIPHSVHRSPSPPPYVPPAHRSPRP